MVFRGGGAHRASPGVDRSLRRLCGGFFLASTGDGFALGAVPLLAIVVDPHPFAVSAVVAANGLPWLLVALPAGAFADRFDLRYLVAVSNLSRSALACVLVFALLVHRVGLLLLLAVVVLNAAARAVYYSAVQASVPGLVNADRLNQANGTLGGIEVASEHLGGPVLGAYVFSLIRWLPFVGEAATLAASIVPMSFVRTRERRPRAALQGRAWDGARKLWSDKRLRILMSLIAALAGLQGLVSGVLVLVATRDWGVRPSEYGLFLAAGAAGNLPGALLSSRVARWLGSSLSLLLAALVAGGCYIVMATAHGWLVAGAAFALAGFVIGIGIVVSNTLRQRLAPPELMGRIGAAWRGIAWGAAPTGALIAGSVAVFGGLRLPLFLAGACQCGIAVLVAPMLLRRLGRRPEDGVPESNGDNQPGGETPHDAATVRPAPGGTSSQPVGGSGAVFEAAETEGAPTGAERGAIVRPAGVEGCGRPAIA